VFSATVTDPRELDLARVIWAAREEGRLLCPPTGAESLGLDAAYRIQDDLLGRRVERGERLVGWKLGYTSDAMRAQMGVAEPNHGPLTDAMLVGGGELSRALRQPRVEPEVAVVLADDVAGPVSPHRLRAAIGQVRAALEVVDSTWVDYRFSLADNTADGSSAAQVVLGEPIVLGTGRSAIEDLDDIAVELVVDGAVVGRSTSAAAMGSPLRALAWLVGALAARGRVLPAGSVVITGGLTAAYPLRAGASATATFTTAGGVARAAAHR